MKEYAINMLRELISPSQRFELRLASVWLGGILGRACLWRWEIARLSPRGDGPYDILYTGRKAKRDLAKALLGITGDVTISQTGRYFSDRTVCVSEIPLPRALCVPWYLSAVVPLGRTVEEIEASYNKELQRKLRNRRSRYRMQQVLDDAGIERANHHMLQPYARARHGAAASQLGLDKVKAMAQKFGRLNLLLLDDEVVGCQLGCVITRAGKRYWSTNRFGYPEEVFSDPKRLREINSFNTHLALEWAIENGFDYYDIGVCLGRPGDGLLEWKRRRGGEVDTLGNHGYFYVRLPNMGEAQFLWDMPLFAVEHNKLTLHLGLPQGPSDEEVMIRYREMGFGGLVKIYLHCARPPGELVLETLRSHYTHLKSPPIVETMPST